MIAVIVPQYIDAGFKATLRFLAKLSEKKILFIELEELMKIANNNRTIQIDEINNG